MAPKRPWSGLEKWVEREDWFEHFKETVEEHVRAACDDNGLDFDELDRVIGEANYMAIWNAAFEDFLTRDLDDGSNITDDYLKRRGWRESPGNRAYLQTLRRTPMSAYAIEAVDLGHGFRAQDLLRDRAAVEVHDTVLSGHLDAEDIIAARIFEVRGRWRVGGVLLKLDDQALDELDERLELLQEAATQQSRAMDDDSTRGPGEAPGEPLGAALAAAFADRDTLLLVSGFLFTDIWLRQVIDDIFSDTVGRMVTRDGEPVERVSASYPLGPETSEAALAAHLRGLDILRPSSNASDREDAATEPLTWRIVDAAAPPAAAEGPPDPDAPIVLDLRYDDGSAILGEVTLEEGRLAIEANAKSHLARAQALLEPALGDRVGLPVVEHEPFPSRRPAGPADG